MSVCFDSYDEILCRGEWWQCKRAVATFGVTIAAVGVGGGGGEYFVMSSRDGPCRLISMYVSPAVRPMSHGETSVGHN